MHAFSVEDAKTYGIEKAILLYNMRFWLNKNVANDSNIHDGYYWTFNTAKAFAKLFPYMNEKSISRWLLELEKDGVIMSSKDYNKHKYDKTKWYTIPSEYAISQNEDSIYQNEQSKSQIDTRMSQFATSNSHVEQPIPYINTDVNSNVNKNINTDVNRTHQFSFDVCISLLQQNRRVHINNITDRTLDLLVDEGYAVDPQGYVTVLAF